MITHHSAHNHNYNKQTTSEATEDWGWLLQIASIVVSVVVADANIVAGVSVDDGADVCKGHSTFVVIELFATSCQPLT